MGLTIDFYKSTAENNRLDKTDYLEHLGSVVIESKSNIDFVRPTFTIVRPSFDIENCNYFEVVEWEKYYYMETPKPTLQIAQTIELKGDMDALMSYRTDILELECVLERQENNINSFLFDSNLKTDCRMYTQAIKFKNGLKGNTLLLSVLGG